MRFRKYCVTVMDNWTPLRHFWTLEGATKWRDSIGPHAHLYKWHANIKKWLECPRSPLEEDFRFPQESGQ